MHSGKGRDALPDISSIIEFSERLRSGVSQQEARRFLNRESKGNKGLPVMPDYTIVEHRPSSRVFKISSVQLYLDERQQRGRSVEGYELWELLASLPVLNASDLEYLLSATSDIPENWKVSPTGRGLRTITFWGTIYKSKRDHALYVRALYWGLDTNGRTWVWNSSFVSLGALWDENEPAAIYDFPF